ncbi:tyrosine-protein phosphatase [Aerococcus sp. UMB1112A]|uniref:tyrosine-protein phosphatase n=1 Tax=Aerococcus sp. UMB1112A TaxID=3050609 RepID=UPI00254AA6FA|nr:tyrosine-protein phosphatase [Aerococcus sp. UMB1112A]MDK8502434.1 tyrosine-protein phosphatase [Aerococcus sp. UMB1112A]
MSRKKQPYINEQVEMERVEDCLHITWIGKPGSHYKLYGGFKPEKDNIQELLEENSTGEFILQIPIDSLPSYYLIQVDDEWSSIFAERVLPLEQAINFRDMGGYRTLDGKRTKWGLLFRSDQLSKLSEQDIKLLENYQLKTIVDYRSAHERKMNPNKEIGTVEETVWCDPQSSFSEAAANAADLNEENIKLVRQLEEGMVDSKYVNGKGLKVIEDYRKMVTSEASQIAYKKFLQVCAQVESAPLVHHCRGGKDRTGFGSMLLLLALGVCDEDIVKDYILTGVIRTERNELKYKLYRELTDNQDYLDYLMSMIETRSEYIKASLDEIRQRYDNTDEYFKDYYDLNQKDLEQMRSFYLE